jgi:uncharacterized phage protein gp47/JayE
MALTLDQLTGVITEDDALAECIAILAGLGYNATSWQDGSVQLTLVRLVAKLWSRQSETVAKLAGMGLNEYASGDWLELFSYSHYANTKKKALTTRGVEVLTASADAPGPFTINASDLVFADTLTGQTFRNTSSGVLNAGGTLALDIEAESPGSKGDVAPNTITVMKTPLAGVTANNPIPDGASSWITRNGGDDETDAALRTRNRTKWATIGSAGVPGAAYEHFSLQAHESVKRVFVDDRNPRGPNTIDIYVAGDAGDLSSTVVQAVDDYLSGITDGKVRKGAGSDVEVYSALRRDIAIGGTIYIANNYNTTATQSAILAAVSEYFKTLDIGGTKQAVGGTGYVVFGRIYTAVLTVRGVTNAVLSLGGDIALAKNEVAVPVPAFSYVSV